MLILLIISLLLGAGAGYGFLYFFTKTKKQKIENVIKDHEDAKSIKTDVLDKVDELTPEVIKTVKTGLTTKIAELEKESKEGDSEEVKSKATENLKIAKQVSEILQKVEKKEDLNSKSYSKWDYAYAGGIGLVVFLIALWIGKSIVGKVKE